MRRALLLLVAFPLSIAAAVVLLFFPRGRQRYRERFGIWGQMPDDVVWFHGASVGEINGLLPLMDCYRSRFPDRKILLTATSVTGLERGASCADVVRLLPLDCEVWVRLAIRKVRVRAFIFGESELWPSLIDVLGRKSVPLYLVNGTLSKGATRWYESLAFIFQPCMASLTAVCVSSKGDEERFRRIAKGEHEGRIYVTGNTKYDRTPSRHSSHDLERKNYFVNDHPILTIGSIRPGEEEEWFPVIGELVREEMKINIVIAPRHREKFEFFRQRLEREQVPYALRSKGVPAESVLFLDTMGELETVYSFSTVAFVGGTLRDYGGHNPLEAAMFGVPVIIGPYVHAIEDVVEVLRAHDGAFFVKGREDIRRIMKLLLEHNAIVGEKGRHARDAWGKLTGALARVMEIVARDGDVVL